MSKSSRMACSFAPAYFHHCRSKPRTFSSRSERVAMPGSPATRSALVVTSIRPPGPQIIGTETHSRPESHPCHSPSGAWWHPLARRACATTLHSGAGRVEDAVSYTHLRAHETRHDLVCRL